MNLTQLLKSNIDKLNIERVFDLSENWIWFNKSLFSDILYALNEKLDFIEEDENGEEGDPDAYLADIDEGEIFDLVEEELKEYDYIRINQNLFSTFCQDYKVTKDIETILFVKKSYYIKMSIWLHKEFDWLLKAMAIDTYKKSSHNFKEFKACYEELFAENYRIIEEVLSGRSYLFEENIWTYIHKTGSLEFEKAGQIARIWTKGEAESYYKNLLLTLSQKL